MFPQIAGRELGDRITVKLTPKGGGSRITRDVWIRGINHNITASDWTTTYALEDATFADNYAYYDIDSYDTATATGTAAVCEYGF
jgi:hypothetical protein